METFETLILVLHVVAALAIIGLVLLQQGKGADMGAGFGSGASSTVFGSGGAGSFLTRLTTAIAIAFFLTSFALAFFAKERSRAARDIGIPVVMEETPAMIEMPELQDSLLSEVPELDMSPSDQDESEIPQS